MAKNKLRALSGVLTGALLLSCVSFTSFAEEEIPADENQTVEEVASEENQEPEVAPTEENQEPEVTPKEENQELETAPEVDNQMMDSALTDAGDAIVFDDVEQNGEDTLSENDILMEGLIDDPVFTAAEGDVSAAESVSVYFSSDAETFDVNDIRSKWGNLITENNYGEDFVSVTGDPSDIDFYWTPKCGADYMEFYCWRDADWDSIIFTNNAFYYDDDNDGTPDDPVEFEGVLCLYADWKLDLSNADSIPEITERTPRSIENEVEIFKFKMGEESAYKLYSSTTEGCPRLQVFNESGFSHGSWINNNETSAGNDFFCQMYKYVENGNENEYGINYDAEDTLYFVITRGYDENEAVVGTVTLEAGAHAHIWVDWIVDPPATVGEAGYRWRYCRICGEEEGEDIPALPAPQPAPAPAPVVQAPPAPAPAPDPITITKAPVLKSVKAAKKGAKATVNLKKLEKPKKKGKKKKNSNSLWNQVSSIQLQYSTDPTFATGVITKTLGKGKASVNIGGLQKGVVYYVRARYAGSGGYSNWSATKTVKVKNQKKGKKK